jgi:hypothetical protein
VDPFLARTLLDTSRHDSHRSSLRNPDDLFPERDMPSPDPVATWAEDTAAASDAWIQGGVARVRHAWCQVVDELVLTFRRLARDSR